MQSQFALLVLVLGLLMIGPPAGLAEALSGWNPFEAIRRFVNDWWEHRREMALLPSELRRRDLLNDLLEAKWQKERIQTMHQLLMLDREAQPMGTSIEALAARAGMPNPTGRPDPGQSALPPAGGNGQLPPAPWANPGVAPCL
jgi:hypothetical protein